MPFGCFFLKTIDQGRFVKNANCLARRFNVSEVVLSPFPSDGICLTLSKLYIRYVLKKQKVQFLSMLQQICNDVSRIGESNKALFKLFLQEIHALENDPHLLLRGYYCSDSISFASNTPNELNEKLNKLLAYVQALKQPTCILTFIGGFHAIVIEQVITDSHFVYYVYDPENRSAPKPLQNASEIALAIQRFLRNIQKARLTYSYPLYYDPKNLLDFHVYPSDELGPDQALLDFQSTLEHLIEQSRKQHIENTITFDLSFFSSELPSDALSQKNRLNHRIFCISKQIKRNWYDDEADGEMTYCIQERSQGLFQWITEEDTIISLLQDLQGENTGTLNLNEVSGMSIKSLNYNQLDKLMKQFEWDEQAYAPVDDEQYKRLRELYFTIQKHKENVVAKNVTLNNILFLYAKLSEPLKIALAAHHQKIKEIARLHLSSEDYLSPDLHQYTQSYYDFFKPHGKITLLHNASRIGDLQYIQRLLVCHSDPSKENHRTDNTLAFAIYEMNFSAVQCIFDFIEDQGLSVALDFEELCERARHVSNTYQEILADTPSLHHDALKIVYFISEKKRTLVSMPSINNGLNLL